MAGSALTGTSIVAGEHFGEVPCGLLLHNDPSLFMMAGSGDGILCDPDDAGSPLGYTEAKTFPSLQNLTGETNEVLTDAVVDAALKKHMCQVQHYAEVARSYHGKALVSSMMGLEWHAFRTKHGLHQGQQVTVGVEDDDMSRAGKTVDVMTVKSGTLVVVHWAVAGGKWREATVRASKHTKAGTLALKYDCKDTDIELLNELTTTKPEALDAVKMPAKVKEQLIGLDFEGWHDLKTTTKCSDDVVKALQGIISPGTVDVSAQHVRLWIPGVRLYRDLYMRIGWCDFTLWVKELFSGRVHCRVVRIRFDDRPQDGKCVDTQKLKDFWVNAIAPEAAVPRKPLIRKHWLSKGRLLEDGKSYVMYKLDNDNVLSYSRDTCEKVRAGSHLGRQAGPTLDLFELGHICHRHGLNSYGPMQLWMLMALYGYGPAWLWPCIVIALYSYDLYSYGLCSYGLCSYGWLQPYIVMALYSYGPT